MTLPPSFYTTSSALPHFAISQAFSEFLNLELGTWNLKLRF